jgi:hypothetical protein
VELKGSENIAVVRDRDRRHPQPRDLLRKLGYPDRGVKQRVVAMQVKMDKWGALGRSAHGAIIPRLVSRRAPSPGILGTRGRSADCGWFSYSYSRPKPQHNPGPDFKIVAVRTRSGFLFNARSIIGSIAGAERCSDPSFKIKTENFEHFLTIFQK